jgi:hypothetical protein
MQLHLMDDVLIDSPLSCNIRCCPVVSWRDGQVMQAGRVALRDVGNCDERVE